MLVLIIIVLNSCCKKDESLSHQYEHGNSALLDKEEEKEEFNPLAI